MATRHFFARIYCALLLLFTINVCDEAQAQNDTVFLKNGQKLEKVNVKVERYKEVQISSKGGAVANRPYELILSIRHGDEPVEYIQAMARMKSAKYGEAIEKLRKVMMNPKVRPWKNQYCTFYTARCYRMLGKKDRSAYNKAIALYQRLFDPAQDSIFRPQAHWETAMCYLEMGGADGFKKAEEHFKKLVEFGAEWKLRSEEGLCLISERKAEAAPQNAKEPAFKAAAAKYEALRKRVTDKKKFLKVIIRAYDGQGRCLLKAGDYTGSISVYSKLKGLANDQDNAEAFAIAYNGLGDCLFASGQYEQAVLNYLRANILYEDAKEQAARGLFKAGECFHKLATTSSRIDKERRIRCDIWRIRAERIFKDVAEKYSGEWAEKAEQMLQTIAGN